MSKDIDQISEYRKVIMNGSPCSLKLAAVVIPACNEESSIRKTILALGDCNEQAEVVVVCNGCTDSTSAEAKASGLWVQVLDTPVGSKSYALNMGDSVAKGYPRFYLDADVRLSPGAIRLTCDAMRRAGSPIASPKPIMDFEGCSWVVRAYYAVWLSLPYVRDGLMGTGVYVLSEEGRRRFGDFPTVIADDGYVRALFEPSERLLVSECSAIVRAPRNLSSLIKIKTRSRLGVLELRIKFPELAGRVSPGRGGLSFVAARPSLWLPAMVYLGVNLFTRWRARRMARERGFTTWERDDSRRGGAPGAR